MKLNLTDAVAVAPTRPEDTIADARRRDGFPRRSAEDLRRRIAELSCLIRLSKLADRRDCTQGELLQAAVDIIPSGWQYPDIACARIVLEREVFESPGFTETIWKQSSGVCAHGSLIGGLEVCYREERPPADEGPFLNDERDLINAVAADLGKLVELKRAYDTLRREKEKYRALFEASDDAIFIVESRGLRVVDCNRRAERMTGRAREKLLSMDARRILARCGESHAPGDLIRRVLESGSAAACEIAAENGSWIPVSAFAAPFEVGGTSYHQIVLHDISAQRETERVLREAKEAAELAARMKSEFVANVSHELRTPMNAIVGFAEILLDTGLTKEQLEFAEIIKASAESLAALTNRVLDFSRLEAGCMEIERIPFEPSSVIHEACEQVRPEAARKRIALRCDIGRDVPALARGDARRFGQVLKHLLENAAKFTDSGEIAVTAEARADSNGIVALRVSVRDTGIGIPREKLSLIFEPFLQADGSSTREHDGAGLGLTICRRIASLLGGGIAVESEPGRGSTFHFTSRIQVLAKEETP